MPGRSEGPERPEASDRDWGRRALNPRSRRVAVALVEGVLADTDEAGGIVPARPELAERTVEGVDLMIGAASPQAQRVWRIGLFLLEWLPLFYLHAFARMSRLPIARRVLYLERVERTRVGLVSALLAGLKVSICVHGYEDDPELAATGFDRGELSARRRLPVSGPDEARP